MRKILPLLIVMSICVNTSFASTPISERVQKKTHSGLELNLPKNTSFLAGGDVNDMTHWWKILPQEDRYKKEYLVIPSNGLVIPINTAEDNLSNSTGLSDGRNINYNKYLETGALKFYSDTEFGAFGNTVIFGHSSYWKNKPGRYKTQFQKIVELDEREEIWIYQRLDDGNYKRYIYLTKKYYNTPATNIDILKNSRNSKKLTLFTCTPIGGIDGRWVVEAYYDERTPRKNIGKSLENMIIHAINTIAKREDKQEVIIKLLKRIHNLKSTLSTQSSSTVRETQLNILTIIEEDLRKIY